MALVPLIGSPAPAFTAQAVVGHEFKNISLSDYKGKWVVLFFYPLDWTFVCPTEVISFSVAAPEFKQLNTEVIGASIDSVYSHLAWINTPREEGGLGNINIPLIGDVDKKLATAYGAMFKDSGHTLRASYIIDPKGELKQITMNAPPVGRSVDEALRLLKAFQFHEVHGEVCPANWKPGDATINPDPVKKLDFFKKQ